MSISSVLGFRGSLDKSLVKCLVAAAVSACTLGILRLRDCFTSFSSHSAQDDRSC